MQWKSAQISFVLHVAVVFALIHAGALRNDPRVNPEVKLISTKIVFHPDRPLRSENPGGGGGRTVEPPRKGERPQTTRRPFVPPTTRPPDHDPALPMPPAIVGLTETSPVPVSLLGVPDGIPGPPSDGPGKGPGIGRGPGKYGAGDSDGQGSVTRRDPTGSFTQPQIIYKLEPEFTEEARKARFQGVVLLLVDIDEAGRTANIRLQRGVGLGLDERAIEAVTKWRFRPANRNGKPVRTTVVVEVSFRLL